MKDHANRPAVTFDPRQEPLCIPLGLSGLIFRQEKPTDLFALFGFYYHTAKWQQNQGIAYATNTYVAQAFGWAPRKVIKTAQRLVELGLIKREVIRDPSSHQITGHRILLNMAPPGEKARMAESHSVAFLTPKEKSLKGNNLKEGGKSSFDPLDLPIRLASHSRLSSAWSLFVQSRKEKRCPITRTGFKRDLAHMLELSPDDVADRLELAVDRGYRGWFFKDQAPRGTSQMAARILRRPPVPVAPEADKAMMRKVFPHLWEMARLRWREIYEDEAVQMGVALVRFFNAIPTPPGEAVPHLTPSKLLRRWLDFLDNPRWPVRSAQDLFPEGKRWDIFIDRLGEEIGINLKTGKKWGRH